MINNTKKHDNGFTLIELTISVAILLSLVGFGTASYVNFNERQILEQAAKTLKNNLRLAQQNAQSGLKNDNGACNDPDGAAVLRTAQQLQGWCVSPQDQTHYSIYGSCDDNDADIFAAAPFPPNPIPFPQLAQGVTLDAVGVLSTTGGWDQNPVPVESRIRFNALGQGVRMEDTDGIRYTKMTYCLRGTFPSLGEGNEYAVTVRNSGEILDEGFLLPTEDCFDDGRASL